MVVNGAVTVVGSTIRGRAGAVVVSDNASVTARGCRIKGGVRKSENGEFNDRGGNAIH